MTTRSELPERMANGENSGVEFQRDHRRPEDLAKELVAFSNLQGGMVLLGVEDDGTVSGLTGDDLRDWVMNVCRDHIRPPVVPFFEVVRGVKDDRDIAIVRVTRGYGVHALRGHGANRYLIRAGSRSREADPEELAPLFQQRGSMRAERRPVSGAAVADLDRRRLRNYVEVIRQQDAPDYGDEEAWRLLLTATALMTKEGVSVGGMLLFGSTPNRFLPHAGISAVAYCGKDKACDEQERAPLRGPMTPLLSETGELLENGIVEQALAFVQRNTRVVVEAQGGRRVRRPAYPREALREAIVNALIHRDYLITSMDIELAVYSDRLEVVSPGRPPNRVTPEGMRLGARSTRNQLLKDVMGDYRYVDHRGMGIRRKIIQSMRAHNGAEPDLIEQDDRFTVRLLARTPGE